MEAPFFGRMEPMSNKNSPTQRRYPPELRERAIRLVHEAIREAGSSHGVVTRVSVQLGIGSETLRNWVKKAEVDRGLRAGTTSADHQRLLELEKENRELRRANEILKAAAGFFARELDPRLPK
jgi:transposase